MFLGVIKVLLSGVAGYLVIALGLIVSAHPRVLVPAPGEGLDFSSVSGQDLGDLPTLQSYQTRNGDSLGFRRYGGSSGSNRVLILVHGSGWHGMQFHHLASTLAAKGVAEIIVPDLRGHGASPKRRGDIDYIAQLENDLADLIGVVAEDGQSVIVGGHSSGGGLVVRFAGGAHGRLADKFILMAPFLKHNAPTTRQNAGGWASPAVRRIIGLSMLNTVGITLLNHLPVISFAMPQSVLDGPLGDTATTAYSFRLNNGFAPRGKFEKDIAAMTQPFLLLAGKNDESFFAEAYESTFAPHTSSGTFVLLEGVDHLGVANDNQSIAAIGNWLETD